jgi:hypothetical protein
MNTTTDPAGMVTDSIRGSSSAGRSSPQRWLPGMISVAPLPGVNSSMAQIVLMPKALRGRGTL